jgi:hypothetical protein
MISIEDPKTDQIGLVIKELQSIPTFTKEKRAVLERLMVLLKESNYKMFNGKANRYGTL